MPRTRALFVCLIAACSPALLRAQTPSPTPTPTSTPSATATPPPTPQPFTTPTGRAWPIDGTHPVNASRLKSTPDGATWFMVPSADHIVKLQNGTMTQWPIRDANHLGANPVDFQFDGNDVWFIENGESGIDAGFSIIAKLDTTNGNLTEYVLPISLPAGFYRTADQKMWVAQTAGVLELVDLQTLAVIDYRANPVSFAGTLTLGPDGALWMTDFANNRIIRHDFSNDTTEKSWTILSPSIFQVRPSDAHFDEEGHLWITEFAGNRVDRFDPATGELRSWLGITNPLHMEIYGGNVYVASADGGNGKITIIDPRIAPYTVATLTPVDLPIVSLARPNARTLQSVITPVPFTPTPVALAPGTDLTLSAAGGFLLMTFNKTNAYGVTVDGGAVWAGTDSEVVQLQAQTIGGPTDQTIPVALQAGTPPADRVRVDLTLFNRGTAAISGTALFQYSAAAYPQPREFTLAAGATTLLSDAFVGALTGGGVLTGSVRLQVASGNAADLVALARTARALPNGGTFGTSVRAESAAETVSAGQTATLFTGVKPADLSTLGLYSPSGGNATLQLVAPDGTVRGTRAVRVEANNLESHNPAASFFGASAEPGDVVRVSVTAGSLQPWVLVQDAGTRDIAIELPTAARSDAVVPNVASVTLPPVAWLSGLQVSNPDATRGANVSVTYYPMGGAPASGSFVVPPGATASYTDVITDLIHAPPGQGSLVVTSDVPVAASFRNAARSLADGTEYAAASRALDGAAPIPTTGADAPDVYASPTRRTNLLLFNRGAAGTVTLTAFGVDGAPIGQLAIPVGAASPARVDRVLTALGATASFGRLRIQPSAGMQLYAQTVNVDPGTGDSDLIDVR